MLDQSWKSKNTSTGRFLSTEAKILLGRKADENTDMFVHVLVQRMRYLTQIKYSLF
jgi:hypothetical protein